jgi:hypothetical protein
MEWIFIGIAVGIGLMFAPAVLGFAFVLLAGAVAVVASIVSKLFGK